MYNFPMDVAVTEFRAHLSEWLERARSGDEVLITERGVPVARLLGLASTRVIERLMADGVVGPAPASRRPTASGRDRPRSRRPVSDFFRETRR
jgi:prevent-host-death family protein